MLTQEHDPESDDDESILDSKRQVLLSAILVSVSLTLYVVVVGGRDVLTALGRVPVELAVILVLVGLCPLLIWGVSLWIVLEVVDVTTQYRMALGFFVASVFMNSITPFGQLGGDPPSGLLIAGVIDARFESALAAIGSVNALNRVAVLLLGMFGGAWFLSQVAPSMRLEETIWLTTIFILLGVTILVAAWRYRARLLDSVGSAIAWIGAQIPIAQAPEHEAVVRRLEAFISAIERIVIHPKALVIVFVCGVAGQVVVAGILWLTLMGLGIRVPFWLPLVVVPAAKLAGITPLPGGSGGTEALLSGLLVAGADLTLPVATAAALLYRTVAFWVPTILGGLVTTGLVVQLSNPSIPE